jgi:hypothetical protein
LKVEVKVSEAELRFSEIKGAGKHVSVAKFMVGVPHVTGPNNGSPAP